MVSFRLIFGAMCLSAALILILFLGYRRFRRWAVHRRRPNLHQGGISRYTGSFRRMHMDGPLPYSGLGSYRGGNHRSSSPVPLFHTNSYKGKKFRFR